MGTKSEIVGRLGNSGIELDGDELSLLEFARRVQRPEGSAIFELSVPSEPPSPYDRYLRSVQIDVGKGNVRISYERECIFISGSVEKMAILAENIESLALQELSQSASHLHIEFHPDHFYLTEDSEPLVLSRR